VCLARLYHPTILICSVVEETEVAKQNGFSALTKVTFITIKEEILAVRANCKCIGTYWNTCDEDLKITGMAGHFWKTTGTGEHCN